MEGGKEGERLVGGRRTKEEVGRGRGRGGGG